ncbi:la-related protein 6A-like isoform X2 [Nymphaea colorata]|uniref:la-related protein 6A-like isoform X2 n=1 Tax=Nymphaea colorata TaxID=210225 RepID=UPI00129E5FB1|nr:la-related protein 6A-like isoform X2 [Nymphaea colorata]
MEGSPASPPHEGESSPQPPVDLGHQIDDDLHGVAAVDRSPELPDDHEDEIGDDCHGDAGDHSLELPGDLEHQIDDEYLGDAGDHPPEPAPPSSSDPVLSDELKAKIVKQVEYYFSNENLFNDKFLKRLMKKDKEGFVPIAVIASFRKMKKLTQDLTFIASALSISSQLTVSSDGKKVKRMQPYPGNDTENALLCTVLVDNLPEDHSVENVQRIFSSVGNVKNVSIRQPNSTSRAPAKNTKQVFAVRGKWHAFVEYETVEAAEKAVLTLNDGGNWRTGMHVQLLVQRTGKHGLASAGCQATSVDNEYSMTLDNVGEVHDLTTDDHHDEKPEAEEHPPNHRNGGRGHQGTRGRGRGQQYTHHVSGSRGTYVKKHELSASSVEAQNSLDAHDEKLEVGGEHLVNEKDEHKGPRRGRGRNQTLHYHSGRGYKGSSYGNDHHYTGDEQHLEPVKGHPETPEVEEHISGERGGWGGRWRGRGRGHGHHHFDAGQSHGTGSSASSSTCEATAKHHPYVPKMPDGTRGFTMGRGRPPSSNTPPS